MEQSATSSLDKSFKWQNGLSNRMEFDRALLLEQRLGLEKSLLVPY
jgi:hypothetical protein